MAAPLASFGDVQDRMPGAALVQAYVETLLADASALVRSEFPDVDARITSNVLDAVAVQSVVANMVKRALLVPDAGVSSQTAGPFAVSYSNPDGSLYLRGAERAILGLGTVSASGARSVRMGY
jgi:hypothetical protein